MDPLSSYRWLEVTKMKIGKKGTGQESMAKICVIRHGGAPKRARNAEEKAIETRVRQAGRKACRDRDAG